MLPGPLQVGDLLAQRYRLHDPVASEGPTVLWRAYDEVLARDVAVRVLPMTNNAAREVGGHFLAAAARAGKVAHPALTRVYDAGQTTGARRGADLAYLVREWVEGEPLDEHLERVGQLAGPDAADVLRQVADSLTAAHAAGLAHGRLHPRNLLVTSSGRVRITDAAVAAAVHGDPLPDELDHACIWRDTRDAGAVLYALLTTRWPVGSTPQPAGGLIPSPLDHGHALAPHQVRAGVPRRLDHVIERALDPGLVPTLPPLRTPAALADATDLCVADARQERLLESAPRAPGWLRRHVGWLLAGAIVALVGTVGWFAGLAIGELPRRPDAVDAIVASPAPASPGASAAAVPLDLTHAQVRDFDPEGDGQENPDQVRNAVDLDATTAWLTSRYKSAAFGGIKQGVGLLVDLGSPRPVHSVVVGFTAPGAQVELRLADMAPTQVEQTRLAGTAGASGTVVTFTPTSGTRARYLLVWLTTLPKDGDGYRVGIAELRVS